MRLWSRLVVNLTACLLIGACCYSLHDVKANVGQVDCEHDGGQ